MVQYNPLQYLPSALELPDSDDTPVDNELQVLIPSLLRGILALLWSERQDWFFGVNMGVYYQPNQQAIVPDGFLSVGVQRHKSERGRLSYVLWEENGVVPYLAIEVVSKTYGQEYHSKLSKYAQIGVLYYIIYNPDYWERDRHEPFEVYRLEGNGYVRQTHEPVLIPEINLAIGRGQGSYEGWNREWLYWYDFDGNRLPDPLEWAQQAQLQAQQAQLQAQQERQLKEDLIAKLQARGIDPDTL